LIFVVGLHVGGVVRLPVCPAFPLMSAVGLMAVGEFTLGLVVRRPR